MRESKGLVFRGASIHVREELVNLTDMWRAAGSDRVKRPVKWLAQDQAAALVLSLREVLQKDLLIQPEKTRRGGATWADRRLAIAYGEYLSPDFHAWCLTVLDNFFSERIRWGEGPAIVTYILLPPGERSKWDEMWDSEIVSALNKVYRHKPKRPGNPRYLASVQPRIYRLILGSDVYREIKRRNEETGLKACFGNNDHQHIRTRDALRECLDDVKTIATVSQDRHDFWEKLDVKFANGMLQLALMHEVP